MIINMYLNERECFSKPYKNYKIFSIEFRDFLSFLSCYLFCASPALDFIYEVLQLLMTNKKNNSGCLQIYESISAIHFAQHSFSTQRKASVLFVLINKTTFFEPHLMFERSENEKQASSNNRTNRFFESLEYCANTTIHNQLDMRFIPSF